MPAPYDLAVLHALRKRGQCPHLPVFVTDSWDWQRRLQDFGCLAIRVQNPSDSEHDWRAVGGLHCMLLERMGNYAALGQALLAAAPAVLETFDPKRCGTILLPSRTVLGAIPSHADRCRRDHLLGRLLRHG